MSRMGRLPTLNKTSDGTRGWAGKGAPLRLRWVYGQNIEENIKLMSRLGPNMSDHLLCPKRLTERHPNTFTIAVLKCLCLVLYHPSNNRWMIFKVLQVTLYFHCLLKSVVQHYRIPTQRLRLSCSIFYVCELPSVCKCMILQQLPFPSLHCSTTIYTIHVWTIYSYMTLQHVCCWCGMVFTVICQMRYLVRDNVRNEIVHPLLPSCPLPAGSHVLAGHKSTIICFVYVTIVG